jgi:O-antigen ligase
VLGWAAAVLAAGAALTLLPVKWLAIGLLASITGVLFLVKPHTPLYVLCFSVPFGSLLSVDLGSINLNATDAVIALALVAWLARSIAHKATIQWPRLALPVIAFVCLSSFSLLHAPSLSLAAKELAKWLEFLAVALIVSNLVTRQQSHALVACLLLAGIAQAVLGAYQFFARSGPEFFAFGRFLRAYGTFEQPNPFGGYMGLIAPLALALVLHSRHKELPVWLKRLAIVGFLAVTVGIAMSGSRGAWLGAGTALGVVAVMHGRKSQIFLLCLLLLAALAGLLGGLSLIPNQVIDRITGFIPVVGSLGTGQEVESIEITDANYANLERLAFWQAAVEMWSEHPWLGAGIGNYQAAYPRYSLPKWRVSLGHAHNYYLNIAAETGLLGLLAYLALWTTTAWRLAAKTLCSRSIYARALALGALGIVVHASVHNLVDNVWVHHMYVHTAIVLGLTESRLAHEPISA